MKRLLLTVLVLVASCVKVPPRPAEKPNCLKSHTVNTGAYVCDAQYNSGHVCHRYIPEVEVVCDEYINEKCPNSPTR